MFQRKRKVFCVGRNKTGTTSVETTLRQAGYRLGNQAKGELLIEDWARRDFRRIIRMCRFANAFQDIPFSLPYTFQALDSAFPGSKFILTVRDSADEWFDSVIRFTTKRLGQPPTPEALKKDAYRSVGWSWRGQELVYGATEATAFDPVLYKEHYEFHNASVRAYFRHRPDDLLVLNLADGDAERRLTGFLGVKVSVPHLNRSA